MLMEDMRMHLRLTQTDTWMRTGRIGLLRSCICTESPYQLVRLIPEKCNLPERCLVET